MNSVAFSMKARYDLGALKVQSIKYLKWSERERERDIYFRDSSAALLLLLTLVHYCSVCFIYL